LSEPEKSLININLSDMVLKDVWTKLIGRETGSILREKLKARLKEDDRIISLDFSNVNSTDKSFAAEFLLPVIRDYKERKLIIGINVKKGILKNRDSRKKMGLEDIDDILKREKEDFLVVDDDGNVCLLGNSSELSSSILNLLMNNNKLTREQINLELDEDRVLIKDNLNYLIKRGYISIKKTNSLRYNYYEADYLERVRPYIGKNLVKNIQEKYNEIVESRHIELPSGLHTDKLYHVSTLLRDPRLISKIGIYLADILGDHVDFVLTTATANNIVLAHRTAQAIGGNAKSIFAKSSESKKSLLLYNGFKFNKGDNGIIIVDVVVTGYTVKLLIDLIKRGGGNVLGIGSIFNLSGGGTNFPLYNYESIIVEESNIYDKDNCPSCKDGLTALKPKIMPGDWNKW
jgi:orotate phosphoribosyltransferase